MIRMQSISFATGAIFCAVAVITPCAWAADEALDKSAMEKEVLLDSSSAEAWHSAESTMKNVNLSGHSVLHWHVPVDYYAGEKEYPIGWPRTNHQFKNIKKDWSEWDYFYFRVRADTNRDSFPRSPVNLSISHGSKQFDKTILAKAKKGQWMDVWIPILELEGAEKIQRIRFNISESDYKHGDTLECYFDEFVLLRYKTPTVLELEPDPGVIFNDTRTIVADFKLLGAKDGESIPATASLMAGDQEMAVKKFMAIRGKNHIALPLEKVGIPAGIYQLVVKPDKGSAAKATIKAIQSPWQ